MSGCCDEYGCRRSQPIHLYLGDFSGQVFASTRTQLVHNGHDAATFRAVQKHDVTDQMRQFIRRNPEWVRSVLAQERVS